MSNVPELTRTIIAAMRAAGLEAEIWPTGGGCMAIGVKRAGTVNDPDAPYVLVTDQDAGLPDDDPDAAYGLGADLYSPAEDFAEPEDLGVDVLHDMPVTPDDVESLVRAAFGALHRTTAGASCGKAADGNPHGPKNHLSTEVADRLDLAVEQYRLWDEAADSGEHEEEARAAADLIGTLVGILLDATGIDVHDEAQRRV